MHAMHPGMLRLLRGSSVSWMLLILLLHAPRRRRQPELRERLVDELHQPLEVEVLLLPAQPRSRARTHEASLADENKAALTVVS